MWRWAGFFLLWSWTAQAQQTMPAPVCGNGIKEGAEECDDGKGNSWRWGYTCAENCLLPRCGDYRRQKGETCDDGNTKDGDKCPADCGRSSSAAAEAAKPPASLPTKPLDPNRAYQLSMTLSLLGPPVLGLLYGPSAGRWYAGERELAAAFTLGRTAAATAIVLGQVALFKGDFKRAEALPIIIGGSVTLWGLALYDILDAPRAVHRANAKLHSAQP